MAQPNPNTIDPNDNPVAYSTLTVATCNVLNLALPGRAFYPGQDPYSKNEYERKVDWLGERIKTLNADVLAVQEVWDEAALIEAVKRSGLRYKFIAVPGAENGPGQHGAQGTPRVGLVTRLAVESIDSLVEFPPQAVVDLPGMGLYNRFERPPLHATLRLKKGPNLHIITAHFKSKRPKLLSDDQGSTIEDRDDPATQAQGSLRSLIMRGAEAVAVRMRVIDMLHRTREPLIMMGDLNDSPHSVTTQLVANTSQVAYDRGAYDCALFSAWDVLGDNKLRRDVAFSHIHQGYPEVLDQILVSEEFTAQSRRAIGEVLRVEVFNDHLFEGRSRAKSDHGFVRALIRWEQQQGQ